MADSDSPPPESNAPVGGPDESPPIQVSLTWLFYSTAVVAITLAIFGAGGFLLGMGIVAFWAWVFLGKNRPLALLEASVAGVLFCCLCGLLPPTHSSGGGSHHRTMCSNNLRQIALALHNYHDKYNSLPPASIADAHGRPMHSWRVLILPFIEQQSLYDQYRFDEPWDGPNNRRLAAEMPHVYSCLSHHRMGYGRPMTSYVAVVGEETAWPPDRGRSFREFVDGTWSTLMVLESQRGPIHWMEPRDLTFQQAVEAFASPEHADCGHLRKGFFSKEAYGRNVAMADGSAHFIRNLPEEAAAQLLGIDNGVAKPFPANYSVSSHRRSSYGNWFRGTIFVVLLLLPLPWVWIRPV